MSTHARAVITLAIFLALIVAVEWLRTRSSASPLEPRAPPPQLATPHTSG